MQPAAKALHEIDTKRFLQEQISSDINKFRNADAFINAGLERLQAVTTSGVPLSAHPIEEDIMERESFHDEIDDNVSSLSKELLIAKQNNQKPPMAAKQAFQTP